MENPKKSRSSADGQAGAQQAPAGSPEETSQAQADAQKAQAASSSSSAAKKAETKAEAQAKAEWTDEGGAPAPLEDADSDASPADTAAEADGADGAADSGPGEDEQAAEGAEADLDPRDVTIADLRDELQAAQADLARARADHFNLNNQYSAYVRRQKAEAGKQRQAGQRQVVEALLSVLDDIQAARDHGDLEGPFAAIAKKLEGALEAGFKLRRYGEAGQEFDPNLHDALMANTSAEVEHPTIAQVLQHGYMLDEQVLRPTKVMVNNPA